MKITGAVIEFLDPPDIAKRRGKFEVTSHMVHDAFYALAGIMRNVVVIRAEHDLASQVIEYTAVSPFFDPVEEGEMTPWYDAHLAQVHGQMLTVQWVRKGLESDKPNFMAKAKIIGVDYAKSESDVTAQILMGKDGKPKLFGNLDIALIYPDVKGTLENIKEAGMDPKSPQDIAADWAATKKLVADAMLDDDGKVVQPGGDVAIVTTQGGGIDYVSVPPEKAVEGSPTPVTFAEVDEPFVGDGSEPTVGSGASVVGDDEIPF